MTVVLRRWLGWGIGLTFGLGLAMLTTAWALDRAFPPNLTRLERNATLVLDRDGGLLRAFAAPDGAWRLPVEVSAVDPDFLELLIAYEDRRFYWHPGVDPLAALRALWQAVEAGEVVSGASTLTMQTVRLLEPRPRTLRAKLIEMARALQLEWHYDKAEILSFYLTLAPYGGNLEGLRAASLFYLGKEPAHLTDGEAALLVALPQSPEKLRPDRHVGAAEAARARVLVRAVGAGLLSVAAAAEAEGTPLPAGRLSPPMLAAHLAERLYRATPFQATIVSTIEGDLQRRAEALVARRQQALESTATIALMVVDNRTRETIAYVGSGGIFEAARNGAVDMVQAVRSPGSTLKPFIYGMAFDALLVHPETVIEDQATRFGDYAPKNFDNFFRGEITVREALQLSLNLPAVTLLDRIGPETFAARLELVGAELHLPKDALRPGLPIGLGGVGVTLEDLVGLYASLAHEGRSGPIYFRPEEAIANEKTGSPAAALMTPLGAWYVTRILQDMPPPPDRIAASELQGQRPIAYKTGTSYGFRDAWAIGYDRDYTVGVWVGRPDGSFAADRLGREWAAPILFEIFDLLPAAARRDSFFDVAGSPPPGILIARSTGDLPANLQRYRGVGGLVAQTRAAGPQFDLAFPVDGAVMELERGGEVASLPLEAVGGKLPLLWLVNGLPIESAPFRRQTFWQPDGLGQARVTVLDAEGRSASATVWIQ